MTCQHAYSYYWQSTIQQTQMHFRKFVFHSFFGLLNCSCERQETISNILFLNANWQISLMKTYNNTWSLQQRAQKCDRFWFIHILLYRFNPIRSQLKTVLDFWLVNVCMKGCDLIKGGHTFGLLAVNEFDTQDVLENGNMTIMLWKDWNFEM